MTSKPSFRKKIPKFLSGIKSVIKSSTSANNLNFSETSFEQLETQLLLADVGVETTMWLLDKVRQKINPKNSENLNTYYLLQNVVCELLQQIEAPLLIDKKHQPYVVLVVGVNGAGKTTTIGKLASTLTQNDNSVLLAAGDTFRAGAVEQLTQWASITQTKIVAPSGNADPASVIFDALQSSLAQGVDVVLADTAGRLHTTSGLIEQLKKIKRVISRFDYSAPHETILVLDATQGQNALNQAKAFHEAIGISSLVVTKLDGTAKGGILLAIARELSLPVRFLATGENISDLHQFEAQVFANALFAKN